MATHNQRCETLPRVSAVRRDIENVNEKIDSINERLDVLRCGLNPIPEQVIGVEGEMEARARQLDDLQHQNKVHSARLKLIQKELECVKLENDMMLGRGGYEYGGDAYGGPQRDDGPERQPEQMEQRREDAGSEMGYPGVRTPRQQGSAVPEQTYQQENQSRLQQEQQDHQSSVKNMNAYNGVKDQFDLEAQKKEERRRIYSTFDSTAINPQRWDKTPEKRTRFDHRAHPYPGGLVFMRYDDSGFPTAKDSITRMLSICRHSGGYLMGSARKENIVVFEMVPTKSQGWRISRDQPPSRGHLNTENAITAFWFTKEKAAREFFENTHRNQFREPCFPTASGYEAFFVPLNIAPPMKSYNTFLFVEFLDARQYRPDDMTNFEAEVRLKMSQMVPDCQPMIVSSRERVVFKPGTFLSPYSRLYISRFETYSDAEAVWRSGLIQGIRHSWNLHGSINVFVFTIQEGF